MCTSPLAVTGAPSNYAIFEAPDYRDIRFSTAFVEQVYYRGDRSAQ
jgi:hypothetical protein